MIPYSVEVVDLRGSTKDAGWWRLDGDE